jgi:hypothetical protein
MAPRRNHQQVESEDTPCPTMPLSDIQKQIGKTLRSQYEPPEELPEQLLSLLRQVTGRE